MRALGVLAMVAGAATAVSAQAPVNPRFRVMNPIQVAVGEDPTLQNGRPGFQSFAVADLNGDHLLDIVAIDPDFNRVAVYLSNGDGTFNFVSTPELGDALTPTAVVVADVASPFAEGNGSKPDGRPDIIVGGDGGEIGVLPQTQDGQFALEQSLSPDSTSGIIGLVPGNFDGQTGIDVAALDDSGVVLFCNDDNGSLFACGAADPIEIHGGSDTIVRMVAGNFDGDANLDLAVLDQDTNQAFVLYGNGDGTFTDPGNGLNVQGEGSESRDMAVGRMDSDSNDDLVVVNFGDFGDKFILVLLGLSNRRFETRQFVQDFSASSLTLADFDATPDRTVDALVGYEDGLAGINLGDGQGDLTDPFAPSGLGQIGDVAVLQSGNLTSDALPDVVALNLDGTQLHVAVNISNEATPTPGPPTATITGTVPPTPTPTATVPTSTPTATNTPTPIRTANYGRCDVQVTGSLAGVAIGRLDDDASPDIAVTDSSNSAVHVIRTGSVQQALRTCAQLMSGNPLTLDFSTFAVGAAPKQVVAVDVDGDGRTDLVVGDADGVTVLKGEPGGGFTRQAAVRPASETGAPVAIVADYPRDPTDLHQPLDMNGDGRADLVVAFQGSSSLWIYYGKQGGGFDLVAQTTVGRPTTVVAGDFNNDSHVDLVAGTGSSARFLIQGPTLDANHHSQFTNDKQVASGSGSIVALAAAFFNNDLSADLLVTRGNGANVGQIYLSGNNSFTASSGGVLDTEPGAVTAAVGLFPYDTVDAMTDAVVASNQSGGQLNFGFGDGTGAFRQPPALPFGVHGSPAAIAVGNVDGDATQDVITANSDGTITVLLSSVPPPTPTPIPTRTPTVTPTPSETGTPTVSGSPTDTPTATPTASGTAGSTATVTQTPLDSPTPKIGNFQLNGSCAIEQPGRPAVEMGAMLLVLVLLAARRRRPACGAVASGGTE